MPPAAPRSEMNVTPLVDVVLVLLIIFMILTPILQTGYDLRVPSPPPGTTVVEAPPDQLIVSLTSDDRIFLNKLEVAESTLAARLGVILENRYDRTVFFSGDDEATYARAVEVMDIIRNSGAKSIGIVLETVPVVP
jgi:biopolymer transport protein ExbD